MAMSQTFIFFERMAVKNVLAEDGILKRILFFIPLYFCFSLTMLEKHTKERIEKTLQIYGDVFVTVLSSIWQQLVLHSDEKSRSVTKDSVNQNIFHWKYQIPVLYEHINVTSFL